MGSTKAKPPIAWISVSSVLAAEETEMCGAVPGDQSAYGRQRTRRLTTDS